MDNYVIKSVILQIQIIKFQLLPGISLDSFF